MPATHVPSPDPVASSHFSPRRLLDSQTVGNEVLHYVGLENDLSLEGWDDPGLDHVMSEVVVADFHEELRELHAFLMRAVGPYYSVSLDVVWGVPASLSVSTGNVKEHFESLDAFRQKNSLFNMLMIELELEKKESRDGGI